MGELCSRPRVVEDADPYEIGNNLRVARVGKDILVRPRADEGIRPYKYGSEHKSALFSQQRHEFKIYFPNLLTEIGICYKIRMYMLCAYALLSNLYAITDSKTQNPMRKDGWYCWRTKN